MGYFTVTSPSPSIIHNSQFIIHNYWLRALRKPTELERTIIVIVIVIVYVIVIVVVIVIVYVIVIRSKSGGLRE